MWTWTASFSPPTHTHLHSFISQTRQLIFSGVFRGDGSAGVHGGCQKPFECSRFNSQSSTFRVYTWAGPRSLSCAAFWTVICRGWAYDKKAHRISELTMNKPGFNRNNSNMYNISQSAHNGTQSERSSGVCSHSPCEGKILNHFQLLQRWFALQHHLWSGQAAGISFLKFSVSSIIASGLWSFLYSTFSPLHLACSGHGNKLP